MKLSLLFCFLSLFLIVSCGSDNDDDDNGTPTVNTPTNEDDRENEDDNTDDDVVSKYTAVVINANGFYEPSYEHSLRADLGRRPVIITGNFEEEVTEGSPSTCSFSVTLTESQADRLERLANRLRICSNNKTGEEIVDFEENDLIYLTGRNGATTEAFKSYIGDFDMEFNWLCGGRSAFYSNMRALVRNKIPANCPAGALSKF